MGSEMCIRDSQTSVEDPMLERVAALSQRLELLERLLDEKFLEQKS